MLGCPLDGYAYHVASIFNGCAAPRSRAFYDTILTGHFCDYILLRGFSTLSKLIMTFKAPFLVGEDC